MHNKLKTITQLLPEGLTEGTVKEIFALIDSVIQEEIAKKTSLLEAKVFSFLRTKIDDLKQHALDELSEENEIFRNARLFENVRSLMSLEINSKDAGSALATQVKDNDNLREEVEVLTQQLNNILLENDKMKSTVKVLATKTSLSEARVNKLIKKKESLQEKVNNLIADKDIPFESSERALVISESEKEIPKERTRPINEFLTDEVLQLLPTSAKK